MDLKMWYMYTAIFFVELLAENGARASISEGTFWQVTDFHYDSLYSVSGDPTKLCHKVKATITNTSNTLGKLGDYKCDSPLALVNSAVETMKKLKADADFILWTGDNVPHVKDSELSETKVLNLMKTVTDAIRVTFPNASVYPVFGNHDPYPSNQMPYKQFEYYKRVANYSHWNKFLSADMLKTFLKGGYYTTMIKFGLRLVALNTPLYYTSDKLTANVTDPAGQFHWLRSLLERSRKNKEKVYLVGHVPPGTFVRVRGFHWFYPKFNDLYLKFLQSYHDVIINQFYGHEHTDSFRIVHDNKGTTIGSMFLSPSVTPWNSTLVGAGYNNPSIRLYTYNRDTGQVTDYIQYYLNLSEANANPNATWKVEYQFTKVYGLGDASIGSMEKLVEIFKSKAGAKLFQKYIGFNGVNVDPQAKCDEQCHINHICGLSHVNYTLYDNCVKGKGPPTHPTPHTGKPLTHRPHKPTDNPHDKTTDHHHHPHKPRHSFPHYMYYIIGGLSGTVIILFIIIAFLCLRQRRLLGQPRYIKSSLTIN